MQWDTFNWQIEILGGNRKVALPHATIIMSFMKDQAPFYRQTWFGYFRRFMLWSNKTFYIFELLIKLACIVTRQASMNAIGWCWRWQINCHCNLKCETHIKWILFENVLFLSQKYWQLNFDSVSANVCALAVENCQGLRGHSQYENILYEVFSLSFPY